MDYTKMTIEEMEARKAAIATECEGESADLDALQNEIREINAEIEKRKAEAGKREEIRKAVAGAAVTGRKVVKEEAPAKTLDEVRASSEYLDAYARYIKTGNADECRMILTETNPASVSGSGPVPVPVLVDQIVRTAWERRRRCRACRRLPTPWRLRGS